MTEVERGRVLTEYWDEPLGDHCPELQIAECRHETDEARSLVFGTSEPDRTTRRLPRRLRCAPANFDAACPAKRTVRWRRYRCSSPYTDDAFAVTVNEPPTGTPPTGCAITRRWACASIALAPSGNFVPTTPFFDFLLLIAGSGITPDHVDLQIGACRGGGQQTRLAATATTACHLRDALRELAANLTGSLVPCTGLGCCRGAERERAGQARRAPTPTGRCLHLWARPVHAGLGRPGGAGKATQQVHIEVFKSLESDPFASPGVDTNKAAPAIAVVESRRPTHTVSWPRTAKALDAAGRGPDAPPLLPEGHGACACTLRAGK